VLRLGVFCGSIRPTVRGELLPRAIEKHMTSAMPIRRLTLCVFVPVIYARRQAQDRPAATSVVLLHARVIDVSGAPACEDLGTRHRAGDRACEQRGDVKVTEGVRSTASDLGVGGAAAFCCPRYAHAGQRTRGWFHDCRLRSIVVYER
jgi:hypothetical protein